MQVKRLSKTFPLGRLAMTLNVKRAIPVPEISSALNRHASCDWGDVCDEDWASNNKALDCGDRLLSVYRASNGTRFWVITEWDRSVTTVLLPNEY